MSNSSNLRMLPYLEKRFFLQIAGKLRTLKWNHPRISWCDLNPNDRCPFEIHRREQTHRRGGYVTVETQIGITCPWGPSSSNMDRYLKPENARNGFSPTAYGGSAALLIISVLLSIPVCGNLLVQLQETNTRTKPIFLLYLSVVLWFYLRTLVLFMFWSSHCWKEFFPVFQISSWFGFCMFFL